MNRRLPRLRRRCGQLDTSPDGFDWIDANDAAGNVLSFLRLSDADGERARLRGELLRRAA